MMPTVRRALWLCLLALALFVLPGRAEGMIRGLDAYPLVSAQEAAQYGEPTGSITLLTDGESLAWDEPSNTYFIPQDDFTAAFDGEIRILEEAGLTYTICPREGFDKSSALAKSKGLTIYGVGDGRVLSCEVIFTPVPVIALTTETGNLPGETEETGRLVYYKAEYGEIWRQETPIEINLRGNTSKWLPKQSYRVKITDRWGEKQDMSFGDLRDDDDWILNPMYADTSKVREPLAYKLWEQVSRSGVKAASSRMIYAEVFINGRYWGLYGVQERIDRKQVDAGKKAGIVYKVLANDRPTVQELLDCEDDVVCKAFEVKFAGEHIADPWLPAAAYIAYLNGEESPYTSYLDMDNTIDYGLWAMFVQAHDCHFKNQFLHADHEGKNLYTLYKIPWDLNHTFGDMWDGEGKEQNYTRYYLGRLAIDAAFEKLTHCGDERVYAAIRARYQALRDTLFTEEYVMTLARGMHEPIYAAIVRDGKRWPECGMGDGNANNLRDIAASVRQIIPLMDQYIASLGEAEKQE